MPADSYNLHFFFLANSFEPLSTSEETGGVKKTLFGVLHNSVHSHILG